MTDSGAMRTGRLVVRYQSRWRRRSIAIVAISIALMILYLMFEMGRFQGGYSKIAEVQRRRELMARIEALETEINNLRGSSAAAELARDVDRKAYDDVEKNLADLQAQVLKQREELTFYRGIVSPDDGIGNLRIQRFQILPAGVDNRFRIRLMLVQSMRQDAMVSGTIGIEIEGVRDNRPEKLLLTQTRGTTVRAGGEIPFQLLYFKNMEHDVELPPGFEPRAVNVEVRSTKNSPVRESYPWQVQIEN